MQGYRHILLGVDFTEGCDRVAKRAVELAKLYQSRLTMVHVVEPLPVEAASETMLPPSGNLESELYENAKRRLQELAAKLELTDARREIRMGYTKREILQYAEEQDVDLIVVGSHGRHGLALLLGSTANAVLHGSPCDVLAVRI